MAEQRRTTRSERSNGRGADKGSSSRRTSARSSGSRSKISARDVVEQVREELPPLLGRPVEEVLGVQRDDDQGWQVIVQVVELSRIPTSTDVLGAYVVDVDDDGELIGYRRRRRYTRSQTDED
ncbi:MAG TPA: gas vesicle protein GvpO [Solirubrobacteraceae bacterium]